MKKYMTVHSNQKEGGVINEMAEGCTFINLIQNYTMFKTYMFMYVSLCRS